MKPLTGKRWTAGRGADPLKSFDDAPCSGQITLEWWHEALQTTQEVRGSRVELASVKSILQIKRGRRIKIVEVEN